MKIARKDLEAMEAYLVKSEKEMDSTRTRVKSLADLINKVGRKSETGKALFEKEASLMKRMYEIKETQRKAKEVLDYYGKHPSEVVD